MVQLRMRRGNPASRTTDKVTVCLCDLHAGETAYVSSLSDTLPDHIRHRLEDLGLDEGAEISLLRRAPLGDPCVYRVRDYDLCLRRHEADAVMCSRELQS